MSYTLRLKFIDTKLGKYTFIRMYTNGESKRSYKANQWCSVERLIVKLGVPVGGVPCQETSTSLKTPRQRQANAS